MATSNNTMALHHSKTMEANSSSRSSSNIIIITAAAQVSAAPRVASMVLRATLVEWEVLSSNITAVAFMVMASMGDQADQAGLGENLEALEEIMEEIKVAQVDQEGGKEVYAVCIGVLAVGLYSEYQELRMV